MTISTTTTVDGTKTYVGSADTLAQKSSGVSQKTLGQGDFLALLTAQLKAQDPFKPLDSADMVAQMATISNTTGIAEMNQSLSAIANSIADNRVGDAAGWIGRSMLVTSNIAAPNGAGEYAGRFVLAEAAQDVSVDLVDGEGRIVKTIELGARGAGEVNFYWDGRDVDGNYIAGDKLQAKVRGAVPAAMATWASVAAVQSPADGSQTQLITPIGKFRPADALQLT